MPWVCRTLRMSPCAFPSLGQNGLHNDKTGGKCFHLGKSGCSHLILLFIPSGISTFWFSAPVGDRGKFGQQEKKKKNLKVNQILSLDVKCITLEKIQKHPERDKRILNSPPDLPLLHPCPPILSSHHLPLLCSNYRSLQAGTCQCFCQGSANPSLMLYK